MSKPSNHFKLPPKPLPSPPPFLSASPSPTSLLLSSALSSSSERSATVKQVYCLPLPGNSRSTSQENQSFEAGEGDLIDHNLFYSSERASRKGRRVGISVLPELEGSGYSYMTEEMRNTKEEVRELWRENRELLGRLEEQGKHIEILKGMYREQTTFLRQELAVLKEALLSHSKLPIEETKPTLETEEGPQPAQPCCLIF